MFKSILATAALTSLVSAAGPVVLTDDNFNAELLFFPCLLFPSPCLVVGSGKAAFVKFFAPWCGHCKSMKPAWDALGQEFENSQTVLIGDMDCTVEKEVCGKIGVKGYPTIKYFTVATGAEGEAYEGGRDLESLKKFAAESLGPSCGLDNQDLCSADQLEKLKAADSLSDDELAKHIATKDEAIKKLEDNFKEEVEKLQAAYQKLMDEKDAGIGDISGPLRVYRAVSGHRAKKSARDEL